MATTGGPSIVKDGLVFAIDAGSERSYSGSGTTNTDLIDAITGSNKRIGGIDMIFLAGYYLN